MGQVTMYSVGEVGGDPLRLVVLGTFAQKYHNQLTDAVSKGLLDTPEVRRDYKAIRESIGQPHPFRIHSSFNRVPRRVLVSTPEQELADRARPKLIEFVQGLTRSEGHFGDVLVLGAYPALTSDERIILSPNGISELPPKDDPRYQTRPFAEALEKYQNEQFHVPYDVALDLDGFAAWVLESREDMGGHATRLHMIERDCGASV
ncbi:MAG TPA: hypothetical protein VJA47_06725 [archaeon]|nr:hypothetical protein [archaeon]